MGIPNSASIANAPGGLWPKGIWLSGDIRTTMDGDVSSYDLYPDRNVGDYPNTFKAETYLSRLAGYNGTTPDRGKLSWGVNKLPSRGSSTEEVRMGDFINFTTTNFVSSSYTLFDNFSPTFTTPPSSSIFDFQSNDIVWYGSKTSTEERGTLYNIAYVDNARDPRLGILFISGTLGEAGSNITQTGSNYDFSPYSLDVNSSAIATTTATTVCVDQGAYRTTSTSSTAENVRMGCFYWQNSNGANVVPYEFNSSSISAPGILTIHTSAQSLASSTSGAQIQKANAFPGPQITSGSDYPVSSLLIFNSSTTLRARLFTVSGSLANGNSNFEIFSGSELNILNYPNSIGKPDKAYTSVMGGGAVVNSWVLYGANYNSSQDGDDTVRITNVSLSNSTAPTSNIAFESNPSTYLSLKKDWEAEYWSSGTYKYGAKSIVPLERGYLALVAKSNGKLDVKYIMYSYLPSTPDIISGSLLDAIGEDRFGNGYINWRLPIGGVSLGQYTEYSSSLVEDPSSYEGSKVEYVVINYSAQPSSTIYPETSVIKIYHNTGDIVYGNSQDNANNYKAEYESFNNWNISMLPQRHVMGGAFGFRPIFLGDYPTNTYPIRGKYFMTPMISRFNYSSAFRMSRNFLTLY